MSLLVTEILTINEYCNFNFKVVFFTILIIFLNLVIIQSPCFVCVCGYMGVGGGVCLCVQTPESYHRCPVKGLLGSSGCCQRRPRGEEEVTKAGRAKADKVWTL